MKSNKFLFFVLAVMGWVGFYSSVLADDAGDLIKNRSYIGGFGTYTGIDTNDHVNGFNGNEYIISESSPFEVDLIPSIDRNFGFGGLVGRREGAYAMEVSYWRTTQNSHYLGFTGSSSYQSINIDMKRYFFTKSPIQPFAEFGVSFPWLVFKDGSTDESGFVGDFSTSGLGLNLGAGVEMYMGDNFSFFASAIQRWSGFDDFSGVQQQHTSLQLDGFQNLSLEGNGLDFLAGVTVGVE